MVKQDKRLRAHGSCTRMKTLLVTVIKMLPLLDTHFFLCFRLSIIGAILLSVGAIFIVIGLICLCCMCCCKCAGKIASAGDTEQVIRCFPTSYPPLKKRRLRLSKKKLNVTPRSNFRSLRTPSTLCRLRQKTKDRHPTKNRKTSDYCSLVQS